MKTIAALMASIALAATPALAESHGPKWPAAENRQTDRQFPFDYAATEAKAALLDVEPADGERNRVLNGEPAEPGEWPWQVGLMAVDVENQMVSLFCGGTMIQDLWVLTAAHCVVDEREDGFYIANTDEIVIMVGTNTISNEGDFVEIDTIFVHGDYDPYGFDSDIALIKLARTPNADYAPVPIPTEEYANVLEQPNTPTIVTGWGRTETGLPSRDLLEGRIQMIDRRICNEVLLSERLPAAARAFELTIAILGLPMESANQVWSQMLDQVPDPINENMLCSGTPEGPRGACDGDSGGPLVVPVGEGEYVQAGIVSWGLAAADGQGCARDAKFSAYTRVGRFTDWMIGVVNNN